MHMSGVFTAGDVVGARDSASGAALPIYKVLIVSFRWRDRKCAHSFTAHRKTRFTVESPSGGPPAKPDVKTAVSE